MSWGGRNNNTMEVWKGNTSEVAMKERDFHGRGRVNNAVRCIDHKENHWEVA